jgi:hypothetical protein
MCLDWRGDVFLNTLCTGVANGEINLTGGSPQPHLEVPNPTAFGRIVKGFLQNSEEAKRNGRRQSAGQIVGSEINFHFCCFPNS